MQEHTKPKPPPMHPSPSQQPVQNLQNAQVRTSSLYYFQSKTTISHKQAVPLQAWISPEGSRKLRLSDFMTTAQDGGKFASLKLRPSLTLGNAPGTYFC